MDRCIFSILQYFVGCGLPKEIAREHQGWCVRIPALSAGLNSALGLARETCQRWKGNGERERGRESC